MTDQKLFLRSKERQMFDEVSNFYRDLIITKEKGIENLKRSNRMLENKIHKQRKELRRLHEKNMDLKEENEIQKELIEAPKNAEIIITELTNMIYTIEETTMKINKLLERESHND